MQGLILLDKPESMTSFAAVNRLRRIFGEKRAGHTGTLDPMATGVLPVLLGRATRLCSLMLESDKRYTAEIVLGIETDTLDITGKTLRECKHSVSDEEFQTVLEQFRGKSMQTPPMYSALKKNGVRLYELARQGVEIEREAREIEIKQLEFLGKTDEGNFIIDVLCSKGTYIRSLASDIGRALGCGAALNSLRRTFSAGFSIDECVTLQQLESNPQAYILSADRCVSHLAQTTVTDNQRDRFLHGGELFLQRITLSRPVADGEFIRVYSKSGELLGLGICRAEVMKVHCVLYEGESK